jgi:threonine synthase
MNALQKGFVLEASRKGEIHGICIIVNLGFEAFIPTYHLAYIGVKKGNAGRGVATELINAAIDKTNGKLSLHVDRPNQRAKKLYEKMGFVHYYDRMLYKGH